MIFVMDWLNDIGPISLITDLIIASVFFAMGIFFNQFISKKREKKNEEKKNFFRFSFDRKPLYEDFIREIHKNSVDTENRFDQKKFEDTLSTAIPILEQLCGNDYILTIHNILPIRAHPLSIDIKSSCLPFEKDSSMMGTEKSVEIKRYSQTEFDEFKTEINQYQGIEIQVTYKHNKHYYMETHCMQIVNDHIEIIFEKKIQKETMGSSHEE